MRICLVQSSYEDSDHPSQAYDAFGDPSRWVPADTHQFEQRFVRKVSEKEDIDSLCEEGFDMYMNWMWGGPRDKIAGVEAAEYLESKGVVVLTNPSTSLKLHQSKRDFYFRALDAGLPVPSPTGDKFPKIVKYGDSCGSEGLVEESVCHSWVQVQMQTQRLLSLVPEAEIVTTDYIPGREVIVLVLEMGLEIVAWEPLELVFPNEIPPNKAFLTRHHKFHSLTKGVIQPKFLTSESLKSDVKSIAAQAFRVAGMANGGGWGRVDMRIETGTDNIFVIEVNPIPSAFYPRGRAKTDWLIEQTYPGGHPAFFDMLVATKKIQLGQNEKAISAIVHIYSAFAPEYDSIAHSTGLYFAIRDALDKFSWSGSVLDLACGTGMLGAELHERGVDSRITGVDICPQMMASEAMKKYYEQPAPVALFQEHIMSASEYDHVACFGAMHFLDSVTFTAVLSRMFMVARKSITFEVDDLTAEYIENMAKATGGRVINHNNMKALERFMVPTAWRMVCDERLRLYESPHFGITVRGRMVRFERIDRSPEFQMGTKTSMGVMWQVGVLLVSRLKRFVTFVNSCFVYLRNKASSF